jgi:D-xylose transport system permease protein
MENTTTAGISLKDLITKWLRQNLQTSTIIVAMVAIWIGISIWTSGSFLLPQNISNLIRQMTVTAILSVGMVLVIVTGNIDLSVGKFAGLISVIVAYLQYYTWNTLFPGNPMLAAVLSVIVGLAIAILLGVIQASIIAFMNVPAFIVTLGFMWIFNGAIIAITEGRSIPADQPYFNFIGQGYLPNWIGWLFCGLFVIALYFMTLQGRVQKNRYGFKNQKIYIDLIQPTLFSILVILYIYNVNLYNGLQMPVLILAVVALIIGYLASNTPFGRYVYAIGGNKEAARLSGINIRLATFIVMVTMGLLCGISGITLASYVGAGTIAAGTGYELDAIAATILGGTSTLGGKGKVAFALVGALIMATITNGLQLMNIGPAWQYMVKGTILIIAVFADVYFNKNR